MMQNLVSHLKAFLDSILLRKSKVTHRDRNGGEFSRTYGLGEDEGSLREQELYYWGAAPGSWY